MVDRMLSEFNPEIAAEVLHELDDKFFIGLFSKIDTHLSARILSRLGKEEVISRLKLLPSIISKEIEEFMSYNPTLAGFLMDTNVTTFKEQNVIRDVLKKLRKLGDKRILSVYIYRVIKVCKCESSYMFPVKFL